MKKKALRFAVPGERSVFEPQIIERPTEARQDFFDMSVTVHYYRAKVEDGQGLKVSVTPQGLLDTAKPVVSPIQRQEGKYAWTLIGSDLEKTYNAGSAKTEISPSLRDEEGFLWFAVSEYNGKSGYSYEVIVEPVDQPSN